MDEENNNKEICYFCNSNESLFKITSEINEILFKINYSNLQSQIYYNLNQILMSTQNKEKLIYMCESCLTKSMNFHYFGIEELDKNIKYDFIDNSKTANLSFLQLMENYKNLSRNIFITNIQIFEDVKNLFDYINKNSQSFYNQFGNSTFLMIIKQIHSLINNFREIINYNNRAINLETDFLNDAKNYTQLMFGRIDSYKMLNEPKIDFNSRQLTYSNYLNFQSDNNYNERVKKNKIIYEELTKNNNNNNYNNN
jgi:hypothetical protein